MQIKFAFALDLFVSLYSIRHIVMILYKAGTENSLSPIKEKPFKLEREIQKLFEQNLSTIMNLEFVKSEFQIKDKRLDTLAYDLQTNAFVIIEYKRDRNTSVFDQGITYNESLNRKLKRQEVDWSQSRVVFASTDFTDIQIGATNFKDLPIELWTVKRFENGIIAVTPIKKHRNAVSFKPIAHKSKEMENVAKKIKVYTEEDALSNKPDKVSELYDRFRSAIMNMIDGVEVKPQKMYIAFKRDNRNLVDINIQNAGLKLFINVKAGKLDDPKGLARDISKVGHWGNGDYEVHVSDTKNLEYILSLIILI